MVELGTISAALRSAGERTLEAQAGVQRRLWRRRTPGHSSRAVFVVGCNRSGTTMLAFQLARSWQIVAFNENDPEAFTNFHLRGLDHVATLLEQRRAPLVLFKPVLDTFRVRSFMEAFPKSRVLFAYRDVNDVINSIMREAARRGHRPKRSQVEGWVASDFAEFGDVSPPEITKDRIRALWRPDLDEQSACALFWLFQNWLYYDLGLDAASNVLLVSYERVVTKPAQEFRSICRFLEMDCQARMGRGVHRGSVGKHRPAEIDPAVHVACADLQRMLDGKAEALASTRSHSYLTR